MLWPVQTKNNNYNDDHDSVVYYKPALQFCHLQLSMLKLFNAKRVLFDCQYFCPSAGKMVLKVIPSNLKVIPSIAFLYVVVV